jgi:2-iminobutanoate/2-iminopropanoate deaminase
MTNYKVARVSAPSQCEMTTRATEDVVQVIVPHGAIPSPNPLSAGVAVGRLLFVSGQTAADKSGVEAQTREVLEKLGAVLRAAGSDFAHVARCGVYLKDAGSFGEMNAVYREYFPRDSPARSTIICTLANADVLIEIDCVAEIP